MEWYQQKQCQLRLKETVMWAEPPQRAKRAGLPANPWGWRCHPSKPVGQSIGLERIIPELLDLTEFCLATFWTSLGSVTSSFLFLLVAMGMSILRLSHLKSLVCKSVGLWRLFGLSGPSQVVATTPSAVKQWCAVLLDYKIDYLSSN